MPELPEVETIVRDLRTHLVNTEIRAVFLHSQKMLEKMSLPLTCLEGTRIREVTRRGKLIVIRTSSEATEYILAVHLKLTGALLINGEWDQYTRCEFALRGANDCTLIMQDHRSFGKIIVLEEKDIDSFPYWKNLGPDPLTISLSQFTHILAQKPNYLIKSALLDQTLIAGIGNIYASEVLFEAGIHPAQKIKSLDEARIEKIYFAIQRILQNAIEECGTSFRNYRDAHGKPGAFQNKLKVYGKKNFPCPNCKKALIQIMIAGRRTVICPNCQTLH